MHYLDNVDLWAAHCVEREVHLLHSERRRTTNEKLSRILSRPFSNPCRSSCIFVYLRKDMVKEEFLDRRGRMKE